MSAVKILETKQKRVRKGKRRNQKRDLTPWLAAGKGDQETLTSQKIEACTSLHLDSRILSRNHLFGLVGVGISVVTNRKRPQKRTK